MKTIIETHNYQNMKMQLGDTKFVDVLQQSFDIVIAQNPFVGRLISTEDSLYILVVLIGDFIILKVTYQYDAEHNPDYVKLLTIEMIDIEQ